MQRILASLILPLMACGALDAAPAEVGAPLGSTHNALQVENGLSLNGLSLNGLSLNGLSLNGLSSSGLSTAAFRDWFNADPALHDEIMRYVARCALAHSESRSFTSESTGLTYNWTGSLGLAPNWSSGAAPTLAEQQVVSACLAAHVNTHGVSIPISVLGLKGDGTPIAIEENELNVFDKSEACLFGNLFNGEGLFAGNDRNSLNSQESTSRRCALSPVLSGTDPACPPVNRVGQCEALSCQLDSNSKYYTRCTYQGVNYRPITTRLRSKDIHTCGDGVCQASESCGTGSTPDNCGVDCGQCT